jgi:aspartate racemase
MMLGVLGGMGPMATVDFMTKIARNTPATCDQEHIEIIVCSAARIPDRTTAIRGGGCDPFPAMLTALRRLERAGAGVIAIACNTAHNWHAALQAKTRRPILHIVDAVVDHLAGLDVTEGRIGLLATDGTIAANIYPPRLAARGFTCVVPDAARQTDVMRAIRLVKAGRCEEANALLVATAHALIAGDCRFIVMGCTEIPLALASADEPLRQRLIDPTDVLARACVTYCMRANAAARRPRRCDTDPRAPGTKTAAQRKPAARPHVSVPNAP